MNSPWLAWLLIAIGVADLLLARGMARAAARHPEAVPARLRWLPKLTYAAAFAALAVGVGLLLFRT